MTKQTTIENIDKYIDTMSIEELDRLVNLYLETKDKENIDMIINFKKQFFDINNREPINNEIIDNLIDKIDMTNLLKTLEYIEKNKNIIEISIT